MNFQCQICAIQHPYGKTGKEIYLFEMDGERNLNLISAYEYYLPSGCVDVLDLHVDVENFARQRMNQIDHEGFVSHHADPPVRENFNFVAVVVTD